MSAELLSSYLDDELTPAERSQLEQRLGDSPELRRDLNELRATRSLIRGLPEVAPLRPLRLPEGRLKRPTPSRHAMPAPSRRPGRLAMAVGGVAAAWLLIFTVGVSLGSLPIVPDVDELALQHAAAAETSGFVEMPLAEMMDDLAIMSDIGGGMALEGVYQNQSVVQARYSDGVHALSVFHEPGEVDWNDMPDSGQVEMMDDGPVWRASLGNFEVLVTERGDLVVTVVTDGDMAEEMAMMASTMVPEVAMTQSWFGRLLDAPGNIIDRL